MLNTEVKYINFTVKSFYESVNATFFRVILGKTVYMDCSGNN